MHSSIYYQIKGQNVCTIKRSAAEIYTAQPIGPVKLLRCSQVTVKIF